MPRDLGFQHAMLEDPSSIEGHKTVTLNIRYLLINILEGNIMTID